MPRVPPGTQAPNGSQRTVNGPLTDPFTANGRIRPLTVNGVRELSASMRVRVSHFRSPLPSQIQRKLRNYRRTSVLSGSSSLSMTSSQHRRTHPTAPRMLSRIVRLQLVHRESRRLVRYCVPTGIRNQEFPQGLYSGMGHVRSDRVRIRNSRFQELPRGGTLAPVLPGYFPVRSGGYWASTQSTGYPNSGIPTGTRNQFLNQIQVSGRPDRRSCVHSSWFLSEHRCN